MDYKKILKYFLIAVICYIVIRVGINALGGLDKYRDHCLDEEIQVVVEKTDGIIQSRSSNTFDVVKKGDVVTTTIPLDLSHYMEDACICFGSTNCVTYLYYEGEMLYSYGQDLKEEGRQIGGTYPRVRIPEKAWGKSLTLIMEVTEDNAFSKVENVYVMDYGNSSKYVLISKESDFYLFLAILVFSLMGFLALFLNGNWGVVHRQGFFLFGFAACLAVWMLASEGLFDVLSVNERVGANAEYVSFFFLPICFLAFLFERSYDLENRKMFGIMIGIYGTIFVVTTFLNYTTTNLHYYFFLQEYSVVMLSSMAAIIIAIFHGARKDSKSDTLLKYGIAITMLTMITEVLRYNIEKFLGNPGGLFQHSISAFGILFFLVIMVASYAVQLAEQYVSRREMVQLEKAAYVDNLTGVANRAGCYREFERITKAGEAFSIIFFDLNDLKKANDVYGHEMGDQLITSAAVWMQEAFYGKGFCGRLGGDEFIAVLSGIHMGQEEVCLKNFQILLQTANKERQFPFHVSIAYGIASSVEVGSSRVDDVLKRADAKMYENKEAWKRNT